VEGRSFAARVVVITTGTFLRGRIHIGTTSSEKRRRWTSRSSSRVSA
jgi:tRNA U34 5-carboxymethylaminomethyl modifying enzyme MnmG/GidA